MEAMDSLRAAAREQGFASREVLEVNREFNWDQLNVAANSLSLFAEKRILELRLPSGSPGADGSKALVEYAARPPEDTVMLIQAGKIDKRSQSAKWFQALDKLGVVVQVWPLKPAMLPQWLQQRLAAKGLQAEPDAVNLLVSRVEGNLLAAAQEVEKLALLFARPGESTRLDVRQMADAVADSARYSVYDLVDAALAGQTERSVKILQGLKSEGVAAPLVLWALSNEIRSLARLAGQIMAGEPTARVLSAVWDSRKSLVQAALKRLSMETWSILLQYCARTDQVIKGLKSGREWDALLQICLGLSGGHFLTGDE